MIIKKSDLNILKFVYSKKTVSFTQLQKKFRKYPDLIGILESLTHHRYLVQIGGCQNNYGEPIPIVEKTMFTIDDLGASEVESKQWFNAQYVLSSLVLPIIVGITSSVLTALILVLLG